MNTALLDLEDTNAVAIGEQPLLFSGTFHVSLMPFLEYRRRVGELLRRLLLYPRYLLVLPQQVPDAVLVQPGVLLFSAVTRPGKAFLVDGGTSGPLLPRVLSLLLGLLELGVDRGKLAV